MLLLVLKWDIGYTRHACISSILTSPEIIFTGIVDQLGSIYNSSRERQEMMSSGSTEFWDTSVMIWYIKTLMLQSHPFSLTHTHAHTRNAELGLYVLTLNNELRCVLKKLRDCCMKHQILIANTVYLPVHNKSSHCHVTDSMERVSPHEHPICLLVMKMLFSGNVAAVFYMLSCSRAHVIWKDVLFITEKYHWRIGSFIKSVPPADSLHILTTSWRAAIINLRPCCVWPQWCMAGARRPSSASCLHSPPVCWSGIPSAALHSLPPNYLPQRLSK